MHPRPFFRFALVLAGFLLSFHSAMQAQTNIEPFGQNRVQTRTFPWRFFDTEHFRVYHYDAAGRTLARYVAEQAERDIASVERKLGGQFPKRFNIILYNNYDEYRQTNVGRKWDSQLQDIPAGTVDLVGDRLVVYFTGVHTDLRRQLRSGMSRVVMQRLLFGDSFREMVKNAIVLNLPQWTVDGFIAYLVDGWDTDAAARWKALMESKPKANFFTLSELQPELAGKAFWKWISESRGENEVKSLLYAMQTRGSLSKGIRSVTGMKLRPTYDSCLAFYRRAFVADSMQQTPPDGNTLLTRIPLPSDGRTIRNVRVSPRGGDVAYMTWKDGEYDIYIQHTGGTRGRDRILSGGRKDFNEVTPDPDYPLLAWSNDGYKLAIIYRKKQNTRLRIYNSLRARIENYTIPPSRFDRILSFSFVEDDTRLIFSAVKKSQTDLYDFRIKGSRLTPITADAWDDIQPWYVSGGFRKGLLFLSNRPRPNLDAPAEVNELPAGPMNVFFYNTVTQRRELIQCSRVTTGNVSQPIQYGSDNFAFLYDSSGVRNQYVVLFGRTAVGNEDSAYAVPVTALPQSVLYHQYNPIPNKTALVIQEGAELAVYLQPLKIPGDNADATAPKRTLLSQNGSNAREGVGNAAAGDRQIGEIILRPPGQAPVFQSEFGPDTTTIPIAADGSPVTTSNRIGADRDTTLLLNPLNKDSTYLKLKSQPYRLSFKPDFFTLRADNSILFNRYQSAENNGNTPTNPPLSGLLTVSLNDALEDHRFTGGVRLPASLQGMAYFLQYENVKRRLDWGALFLRTEQLVTFQIQGRTTGGIPVRLPDQTAKTTVNILQGTLSYPLDRIRRISLQVGGRLDTRDWKARDTISLKYLDPGRTYWALSRLEYVFDNSATAILNIRQGYRYKFFVEGISGLNAGNGAMYNVGFDFRQYQKLYRYLTLASRIAGAHSGGKQRILYFLGGVDNWIAPRIDNTPVGSGQNFAFQTTATNLRGYLQNARNGNTYAVINEEIRFPVLSTLLKRPVQSSVLKHLQLVAFTDIGSAWNGLVPNTTDPSRSATIVQPSGAATVVSTVSNIIERNIGWGYGAGLRTMLFGYFTRLDAAWSLKAKTRPVIYLSFGTDF